MVSPGQQEYSEKVTFYKSGTGPSSDSLDRGLALGIAVCRPVRNKFLWYKTSGLWYFVREAPTKTQH